MRISRALGRDLPITVVSTYLGAHGLAPEYAGRRDDYVDFMCNEVLPEAVRQGVVDQVDGFCDKVGFSHAQMDRLFDKAASYGLRREDCTPTSTPTSAPAPSSPAIAACRPIISNTPRGRRCSAMAEAGTVATLLPGAHLTLHETRKPPVEMFRELGVPMALATNSNPVSSPTVSPSAQMHLACYLFRLTPEEALRGFTVNGAKRPGSRRQRRAASPSGRAADLAVWDTDDPRGIAYAIGGAPCLGVVKNGVVVHEAPAPAFARA